MHPPRPSRSIPTCALALAATVALTACRPSGDRITVRVTFPPERSAEPLDGRLILVLSQEPDGEPRAQVTDGPGAQPVFGLDVEGWAPGAPATFTDTVFGYPVRRLGDLPAGTYRAQAILNRYQTFHRADGLVVKLPPDKGEGQQWASKPGNLYSPVAEVTVAADGTASLSLALTEEIPPIPDFATQETEWVKYVRIRSQLLSDFWGTDMYLGAWVLLPVLRWYSPDT